MPAGKPIATYYPETPVAPQPPADLGHIIASGVSTSVNTAVAAATAIAPEVAKREVANFRAEGADGATVESVDGTITARSPSGATSIIYPADKSGRRKIVATAPNGARSVTYVDERTVPDVRVQVARTRGRDLTIDQVVESRLCHALLLCVTRVCVTGGRHGDHLARESRAVRQARI